MSESPIRTRRLNLRPQTRREIQAFIERMAPPERAQLSEAWLSLLEESGRIDPWIHGFIMLHGESGRVVGRCGFKGPPDPGGMVEIAYGVNPEEEGKGYATETAAALTDYAFTHASVQIVRAHTLPQSNASARVLTKCGFEHVGEVMDPEDGLVWRWEKSGTPGHG